MINSLTSFLNSYPKNKRRKIENNSEIIAEEWLNQYKMDKKIKTLKDEINLISFPSNYKPEWCTELRQWLTNVVVLNINEEVSDCSCYHCRECVHTFQIDILISSKPRCVFSGSATFPVGESSCDMELHWNFQECKDDKITSVYKMLNFIMPLNIWISTLYQVVQIIIRNSKVMKMICDNKDSNDDDRDKDREFTEFLSSIQGKEVNFLLSNVLPIDNSNNNWKIVERPYILYCWDESSHHLQEVNYLRKQIQSTVFKNQISKLINHLEYIHCNEMITCIKSLVENIKNVSLIDGRYELKWCNNSNIKIVIPDQRKHSKNLLNVRFDDKTSCNITDGVSLIKKLEKKCKISLNPKTFSQLIFKWMIKFHVEVPPLVQELSYDELQEVEFPDSHISSSLDKYLDKITAVKRLLFNNIPSDLIRLVIQFNFDLPNFNTTC